MYKLDESLLSGLPQFAQLKRSQIREILILATSRLKSAGATVFRKGSGFRHFYLLLDGAVRGIRK